MSTDSLELGDGVVIDLDANDHPAGIDIDRASEKLDLTTIETSSLPFQATKIAWRAAPLPTLAGSARPRGAR